MNLLRTGALFVATAIAEIVGCYLPYLWLWKEMKLAVEPAAALPLAALHTGLYKPRAGEKVCLIICGANVDPASLG